MLWISSEGKTDAVDYIFNATSGTSSWSTTTVWTPNGTPGIGDNIDATLIASGGATLNVGGISRTINNLTKTVANRWNIGGGAATLGTLNIGDLTLATDNMIFFNGSGGGGLEVNAANLTINTGGGLYFGSTSLTASNSSRGLTVSGTTMLTGGFLRMNVSNASSNSYALGLLDVSGAAVVTLNNAPAGKAASTANIGGLNGSGGFVQTNLANSQFGNVATLAITNTSDHSSATVLRDGASTAHGGTLHLTKAGAGTQTLAGVNTYTGATTITNGVLKMGDASALGARTGILAINTNTGTNVSATGTLDLGGQTDVIEVIRLNGTGFGGNGALINSGTAASIVSGVASITQTASGSVPATLTLSGGGGTGATATVAMGVTSASFTINGGTTVYSAAPTVTISGGGAGITATATAILSGGIVTGITIVTPGSGYTSAPVISFSGGTVTTAGTNPSGTGNATSFTPSSYSITATGSGYTSAPTVAFSNGTFAATTTLSGIVLEGDSSIGGSGDITVDGVVSESGGSRTLTKVGANVLTLTNTGNSYTGGTIIDGGTVSIAADTALGTAPGTPTPAHLTFNGGTLATTATLALNSNRGISLDASGGTVDVAASTTLSYGGIAAGTGSLTKTGTGTLILSGVNTYSGSTVVNAGVLSIAADSGLGTAPGAATPAHLTFNGGTLATTADMTLASTRGISLGASGGMFDVAAATTLTHGGIIADAGGLTKTGTGTLALSGASSYSGATAVNAGTLAISNNTALGTVAGGVTVPNLATLQLSGDITVGDEALSLTGDGTIAGVGALVNLSGSNTWGGDINVTAGATRINSDAGNLLITGDITTNGTGNLNVGGNGDIEISGVLTGPLMLFKSSVGGGTLTLSNPNNSYSGRTTIAAGTLKVSTEGNLGAAPGVFSSINVRIRSGGTLQTTADMSLGANRGITISNGGGAINTDTGTTLTVNSRISGTVETDIFSKTGGGTLVLAGASTYIGPTQVNAGTLMVTNTTGSGAGTGAVSVITGTLAGNHTSTGNIAGSVIIGTGSALSPGSDTSSATHGIGTLKFTAVDLQTGSTGRLNIEGATSFDRVLVSASNGLTLNGRLSITTSLTGLAFDTAFAEGNSFDLLDWTDLLGGTFAVGDNLRNGSSDDTSQFDLPDLTTLNRAWDISQFLSNGTIIVSAVPEPSRAVLLLFGLVLLFTQRRQRTAYYPMRM
ncbi:autotransporter-associated beta strand repeat-containing protein [Prosthecobacter sp.]|uniref:beta strand repeat-containing protein n=1 Tax=Prosthecobacter sp. TaxID=1965333 RepID=UPI002ABCB96F|nr:autotransporter-associated beta strand repeat-containing protein [Prosthecobacter sp.]MDZ4403244.1 autotransporter-associated beta strand repeat-containing protein [Prosthecobacter sp.]